MKVEVAPSILAANFSKLGEEIDDVIKLGADRIHFDVMDGHFVPNLSFGAPVLKTLDIPVQVDCHLMVKNPWDLYEAFAEAGADTVIFHEEVCETGSSRDAAGEAARAMAMRGQIKLIKDLGMKAGISIKPKTGAANLAPVLSELDQILVMTVEPGFGGQKFMADMVVKMRQLREMGFEADLAVDGGVNLETAGVCREAGANVLIAGSAIFKAEDRGAVISGLKG
jgi:ribulose-phosphate 3-epimerase